MTPNVELETTRPSVRNRDGERGLVAGLRRGLALVPQAWRLIRGERLLWGPAVIPVLVTTGCVSVALVLAYGSAGEWLAWIQAELPSPRASQWYSWLWVGPMRVGIWLLSYLWVAVLGAASVAAALFVSALIASPVLDVLSQRVERVVRGAAAGDEDRLGARSLLRDAASALLNEAKRLAFFAGSWLAISAVGVLLPFGPLLAPAALLAFTVTFLPLEYAGFALDRRRVGFRDRRRWLAVQRATTLGFGASAFAMTWVPGLNFLLLPLLVTSGTLLVLECPPDTEH
ncbi:MAG: EI24 domain-containing protein [Myxococcota bacterium]|nr:EI24 domain-containing protein [Myxococcota bacterium]